MKGRDHAGDTGLEGRPLPDNTHNRQTSMPPVGFEPTISAREQPQTYALDRAATGTGPYILYYLNNLTNIIQFQLLSSDDDN